MSTPHIHATRGDFAETVLLPGDPARAEHIAATLLDDAREVTRVRRMLGFTGTFRGHRVSVMGTGMGIPSLSIYATELVRDYGARRLIRVGTCGAVRREVGLGDLVAAQGASTDSRVNRLRFAGDDLAALASYDLLHRVTERAAAQRLRLHVGNVFSTDSFYHPDVGLNDRLARFGILAIEMEAAGLYALAAEFGVEALAVLTASDLLWDPAVEPMDAVQRQIGVDAMTRLVLESVFAPT